MSIEMMEYLLKFDSVHGLLEPQCSIIDKDHLQIGSDSVRVYSHQDPRELFFIDDGADVVIEATGLFLTKESVRHHIDKGIKHVIFSAPAKDDSATFVLGVNEHLYSGENILSNASCTTNCLAPVAKIIDEHFGIESGLMTTIHSYTNDQNILDGDHRRDIRRSRAAAVNMIPTTTGAAKAIDRVLPNLKGKLNGRSVRVPVPNVSMMDLTLYLQTPTTEEQVNTLLKDYASTTMQGILAVDTEQKVSQDFQKNSASSSVALDLTQVINGKMLKIMSWYDNEWGYSNRIVELSKFILKR